MHAMVPNPLTIFNGILVIATHFPIIDMNDIFLVSVEEESRYLFGLLTTHRAVKVAEGSPHTNKEN